MSSKLDDVFDPDGHLNDVALTALADDERSLLPDSALEHADSCEQCGTRLGEHALLSLSLSEALQSEAATAPAAFPLAAIVIATVLAVLGAVPTLLHAPQWLPALPAEIVEGGLVALRAGLALLRVAAAGAPGMAAVWSVAALVLAAIGLVIARLAPREVAWKGVEK